MDKKEKNEIKKVAYEKPMVKISEEETKTTMSAADGAFIGTVAVSIIAAYYGKHCP